MDFKSKLHFLSRRDDTAARHLGASLLGHLVGTYEILRAWGEARPVCDAGLFHSGYGTQRYRRAMLVPSDRGGLRRLIGEYGEQLVFRYAGMDPESLPAALGAAPGSRRLREHATGALERIDDPLFGDLCHVVLANWLEQRPRMASSRWAAQAPAAAGLRDVLCPAARKALAAALETMPADAR